MTKLIQTYIAPFFASQGRHLTVGFLGKETNAVSLSTVPERKLIRAYTDGDKMLKSSFTLSVRFPYGVEGTGKVDAFFEALHADLLEKNAKGILPELTGGSFAVSVESDLSAKKEKCTANSCVYSVKIHLTHYNTNQKGWMI